MGETTATSPAAADVAELFARHGRMVLGLCRLLLRDPVEAEDAAQQTFLSAHQSLLRGAGPRDPAPWLAAIARNECWARMRARSRQPVTAPEPAADLSDPLAEAIRNADLRALWRALEELPRRQRRAFLLRELSGLSYGELAVALAVSEPAVESLLFRARQHVRTRLVVTARTIGWPAPLLAKFATAGVGVGLATAGATQLGHDRPPPPRAPVTDAAPAGPIEGLVRRAHVVPLVRVAAHDPRARLATVQQRAPRRGTPLDEPVETATPEVEHPAERAPETASGGRDDSQSSSDEPSGDSRQVSGNRSGDARDTSGDSNGDLGDH